MEEQTQEQPEQQAQETPKEPAQEPAKARELRASVQARESNPPNPILARSEMRSRTQS